jgi:hypothetical protein
MSLGFLNNGRELAARFWRRDRTPSSVQPGNRYCRKRRDNVKETATVLDLRPDSFGIPHVRFTLAFEQPSLGCVSETLRVLCLSAFVEAYSERIA